MVAAGRDGVWSGEGFFGYRRTPRQKILRALARKGFPGCSGD